MCSCCCHELRPSARPRSRRARRLLPFLSSAAPTATCVCARRCGVQVSPSMLSSLRTEFHGSCCTVLAAPTTRSVSASGGAQGPAPTKRTALRRWHPRVGSRAGVRLTCGTRCARTRSPIRVGLGWSQRPYHLCCDCSHSRRLARLAWRTCVPQHRSRHKRHIPRDLHASPRRGPSRDPAYSGVERCPKTCFQCHNLHSVPLRNMHP